MSFRGKAKKSLFSSPFSASKENPKKLKLKTATPSPSSSSSFSPASVHVASMPSTCASTVKAAGNYGNYGGGPSSFQDEILSKVNEALSIFKPASGDESDHIGKMIPILATALSVMVGEVIKGVTAELDNRLHRATSLQAQQQPGSERLLAAVRKLTYENDRLQQYSRRESVRVFGIPLNEGETAEQVEQKAIKVLKDTGVDVSATDIAVVHRAGKAARGTRPVLVKFVSRRKRNEVMVKKKNLKSKPGYERTFINDDITPLRARLLGYVKRLGYMGWTIDGKIMCTKKSPPGLSPADHPKPIAIETPDDLFKLGVKAIDYASLGLEYLSESPAASIFLEPEDETLTTDHQA